MNTRIFHILISAVIFSILVVGCKRDTDQVNSREPAELDPLIKQEADELNLARQKFILEGKKNGLSLHELDLIYTKITNGSPAIKWGEFGTNLNSSLDTFNFSEEEKQRFKRAIYRFQYGILTGILSGEEIKNVVESLQRERLEYSLQKGNASPPPLGKLEFKKILTKVEEVTLNINDNNSEIKELYSEIIDKALNEGLKDYLKLRPTIQSLESKK